MVLMKIFCYSTYLILAVYARANIKFVEIAKTQGVYYVTGAPSRYIS
jgi:Na+/alanine symporter